MCALVLVQFYKSMHRTVASALLQNAPDFGHVILQEKSLFEEQLVVFLKDKPWSKKEPTVLSKKYYNIELLWL